MMTLEEAIAHAEKRASADCSECAKEHAQLAEWLKELKSRRGAEIQTREATEAKPCPVDRGKLLIGLECCSMTEDWQITIEVCEIAIEAIKTQEEAK